jgi:hypothetical protein
MLLTLAAAAKAALFWPPAARPEPIFRTIESYCSQGRSNDTVIVSAGDQFYSTLLPLRNVRYAFHEAEFPAQGFAVDFRTMGIAVTVDEFLNIDSKIDDYQRRLQEWGVRDSKPIATVVLYRDESELERLIRERAHTDFILVHGHVIRIRYGVLQEAGYPAGPCRM